MACKRNYSMNVIENSNGVAKLSVPASSPRAVGGFMLIAFTIFIVIAVVIICVLLNIIKGLNKGYDQLYRRKIRDVIKGEKP